MTHRSDLRSKASTLSNVGPRSLPSPVMDEAAFLRLAMADSDRHWELYDGTLKEKPGMSMEHNDVMLYLATPLAQQLPRDRYRVRSNSTHVKRTSLSYFIPDVFVVPTEFVRSRVGQPHELERYDEPLPLVVEVWSRSTGTYDVETKLAEYQERGDLEIWRLHPYELTLTAWRRRTDGAYEQTTHHGGIVEAASLPGVRIDLDALFDFA